MKYAIDVLRSAQKRLAKLSPQDQDRIVAAIAGLSEAPRPAGSQKLTGRDRDLAVLPVLEQTRKASAKPRRRK